MDIADTREVQRRTKLRHSLWPYWSLIPIWAWASWLHAGILTKDPRYFVFAVLYAAPFVLPAFVSPTPDDQSRALVNIVALAYVLSLVHVFRERRKANIRFADLPAVSDERPSAARPRTKATPLSTGIGLAVPSALSTDQAASLPAPPPALAGPKARSRWEDFKTDVQTDRRRQKVGIDAEENWGSATFIPILPCNEGPDMDNEIATSWKRPSIVYRILRPFNFLFTRQFHSAISVFDQHFYVSQASHIVFLLPWTWSRPELVRRHRIADVLRLVITPRTDERPAYNVLYESLDSRKTSEETFRLYVQAPSQDRAGTTSNPGGGTVVKYVFRVADDVGPSPISLQEALTRLHHLVPAEKHSSAPITVGHSERAVRSLLRQSMRNKLTVAWVWFGLTGVFAVPVASQGFAAGGPGENAIGIAIVGSLAALCGVLGRRSLRQRSALRTELTRLDEKRQR